MPLAWCPFFLTQKEPDEPGATHRVKGQDGEEGAHIRSVELKDARIGILV